MAFALKNINADIQKILKDWHTPDALIAVVDKTGVSELYNHTNTYTHETLFPIASLSKAMTGFCLGRLAEQHHKKISDPVKETLQDFEIFDPYCAENMQWIDLITHRAGLPVMGMGLFPNWGFNRSMIKDALKTVKPRHSFRSNYAYNNALYVYAEDLIEKLAGTSYPEYIQNNLFDPLNMCHSFVGKEGLKSNHDYIKGFVKLDQQMKPYRETKPHEINFYDHPETYRAGGGIVSSIADLAKWLHYNLFTPDDLINFATINRLRRPYITIDNENYYAAGWRISDTREKRVLSHGGHISGIQHQLAFIPDAGIGFIILTNLSHTDTATVLLHTILDHYFNLPPKNYSGDLLKMQSSDWDRRIARIQSGFQKKFSKKQLNGHARFEAIGNVHFITENNENYMIITQTGGKARLHWCDDATANVFFVQQYGANMGHGNWGQLITNTDGCPTILQGQETHRNEIYSCLSYQK